MKKEEYLMFNVDKFNTFGYETIAAKIIGNIKSARTMVIYCSVLARFLISYVREVRELPFLLVFP